MSAILREPASVRVYLVDVDGRVLGESAAVFNANASCPISIEVASQCNMGGWHVIQRTPLVLFSPEEGPKGI